MQYLKDALAVLFESRQKQVIALLLIIVAGFAIREFVRSKQEEVEQEIELIEEEVKRDEIEAVATMKDVEDNGKQIRAIWISIKRIEDEHKHHIDKKRH